MNTTRIKVSDYYGNPSYYSVMPQNIFDLLEAASLNSLEFIDIDSEQYNRMVEDYNLKMNKQ